MDARAPIFALLTVALLTTTPAIPAVPTGLADLAVTDLTWSPEDPQPGERVTIRAVVENEGDADARFFEIWVGRDDRVHGSRVYGLHGGLAPGESTVVEGSWNTCCIESMGHTVWAEADPRYTVPETDESDNRREADPVDVRYRERFRVVIANETVELDDGERLDVTEEVPVETGRFVGPRAAGFRVDCPETTATLRFRTTGEDEAEWAVHCDHEMDADIDTWPDEHQHSRDTPSILVERTADGPGEVAFHAHGYAIRD